MEAQDFKVSKKTNKIDFYNTNAIRKMWEVIAKRPSIFDMEIIDALKATINSTNKSNLGYNSGTSVAAILSDDKYGCYGDKLYLVIREKMIKFKLPNDKKINLLYGYDTFIESKESYDSNYKSQESEQIQTNANNVVKIKMKKDMPLSKTEIILQRATIDKLNVRVDKILSSFNYETYIQPGESILKSDILEMRAIGFIYMSWHLLSNTSNYIAMENFMFPLSVIVSLQRLIKLCDGYVGYNVANPRSSMEFSSLMVGDLRSLQNQLIKAFDYNGVTLYTKASELILGSPLDIYLPKKARTGFPHQIKVSETLLTVEPLKRGFMMFYRTMTNSGKTSSIINMAAAVELLRKKFPSVFGELQIIATCDVVPVITRWGQLLYHAGYPFGIGAKRNIPSNPDIAQKILMKAEKEMADDRDCVDVHMRFSNSDTCKSLKDRLVIICPPEIALQILQNALNASTRFILLHDEPTMFAESVDSPQLKVNMAVMHAAPKWAIFSSATLPYEPEKARVFIEHHRVRFPDSEFIDNTSAEIYSCCNLRKFDGSIITPHLGIRTRVELANAITHINNNPFLGKLYTPISTKELYERACAVGYENKQFAAKVPRIMRIFNDVDNLFPDKIRTVSLDILKAMLELDDSEIEEICSGKPIEYESDSEDENSNNDDKKNGNNKCNNGGSNDNKEENISFSSTSKDTLKLPPPPTDIDFGLLGTKEAYRFPYLNLIASDTPRKIMQEGYSSLLDDVKKKITSLAKLQGDYEQRLDAWQAIRDSLEKKIKNQDALSKKLSEHADSRPSLIYPDDCQINTRAHINKYSKYALAGLNSGKFRIPNTLDPNMLDEFHITEDMKLGLLSGVCFYTAPETAPDEDEDYLNTALELTSLRNIETLVADSSICYGTDYPIGGVIITSEFAAAHSLNTLYQLMSRAGRGRKSSNAEIYVSNECLEKILATVRSGADYVNQETENMIKVFNTL
jgi:hypothetical protein